MNGWHRLWISISTIYLFVIIFFAWIIYPETNQLYENWYKEIFNIAKEFNSDSSLNSQNAEEFRLNHPEMKDKDLIRYIENDMTAHPENYNKCPENIRDFCDLFPPKSNHIQQKWESELNLLNVEQKHIIKLAILAWILPLLAIYILGWLFKWVLDGFKKRH